MCDSVRDGVCDDVCDSVCDGVNGPPCNVGSKGGEGVVSKCNVRMQLAIRRVKFILIIKNDFCSP